MKYGESTFAILYLLFAIVAGCVMLAKARCRTEKLMGLAALILGCGDAFRLVPRVLHYFIDADFTMALGLGKLVTSLTMTVFYVLLFYIWQGYYREARSRGLTILIVLLTACRFALCALPQNGWLQNSSDMTWGILRNVPFVVLGGLVCLLYCRNRRLAPRFAPVWVYILLSFLFDIPVAVAAGLLPILGMLMLPETLCYILLIVTFLQAVLKDPVRAE